MIVRRACPRLCAALSLLALVAASCGGREGPQSGFDLTKCVETGLCECTDNDQCPGDRICVNGWCQAGPGGGSDGGVADAGRVPDLEADVPVEPGALGWPCADDGECDSGVCLEITESLRLCTQTCIAECPPGWDCRGISQGDTLVFYCLPRTDRLCQPCLSDASCTGPGSLCVDLGGIPSCGRDCAGGDCPTGYVCEDVVSVDGVAAPQCIPESGVCQCTPENIGESFPCGITNDAGTCFGAQVCLEDGTLTPCSAKTPAAEVCDGKDNNCDGFADEDAAGDTCLSENEHGTCEGTVQCLPGGVEACSAAEPAAETCDTLDNDCDGETDEDFRSPDGLYTDFEHCGTCGQSCEGLFAHAVETACLVAEGVASCGILSCEPGFALSQDQSICLPAIHHLCEPCVEDASCVGPGDRCLQLSPTDQQTFCGRDCAEGNAYGEGCPDGYVCAPVVALDGEAAEQCIPVNGTCDCTEAAEGLVKPCTQVTPDGICYGIAVCDPVQGWTGCTAKIPAPEFCDGLDNDCDGIIDQGLTFVPCTVSSDWGTCTGQTLCLGIDGETCTAALPAEDVCNGLDDDCDGVPDDDFASVVPQTDPPMLVYHKSLLHCGGCGVPCAAVPPATATACIADGAQALCVVTACGEGYVLSDGGVCLPLPTANLCLPCAADAQCLGPTDQCVDYPDGSFCGRDCSAGSPYSLGAGGDPGFCTGEEGVQGCCPPGFLCAAGQCVRESQSCACDQDGKVRPCEVGNAEGTCTGLQECIATGPAAGWQPCSALTPAPEICDGVDNDCDGLFDALDPGIDVTGLDGYPSCQNVSAACTGSWTCGGAGGGFQWFCSAKEPEPETCNGLDDDCDAMVDEDFLDAGGEFGTLAHCGRCNLDCTQALAHLATDAGGAVLPDAVACEDHGDGFACVPLLCEAGYYPFPQDDPLVCLALSAANCQPCVKPGDCAGPDHGCFTVGIDDGAWCAQRCDAGALFTGCTGEIGAQGCCPAGFTCEAVPGAVPGELHCRPLADTCQCSAANEGLVKPCTATGDGGQVTCWGITTCGPEGELFTWGPCDTSGSVEVCDGLDNDCDGTPDEGFLTDGAYASDAHCGACGKNCTVKWSATEQHVTGVCDPGLPGGPDCVLGACLADPVGASRPCTADTDCVADPAGTTCHPELHLCAQACLLNSDCPGGVCREGWCAASCSSGAQCVAAYGPWSTCVAGACRSTIQWTDRDGWTGNGCECPALAGLPLDEPETFPGPPEAGAAYVDRDCDGIDGDRETALFVVAGAAGGDGSLEAPYGTVQAAVNAFNGSLHSHILVAAGTYPERVALKAGVRLYGGYRADFLHRDVVLLPTILGGPAPDFAGGDTTVGTVRAVGITTQTVLAGFTILGYDVGGAPAAAGKPSVAVFVQGSSSALRIVNNRILGGPGGPGLAGDGGAAGAAGGAGSPGVFSAECITGVTCTTGCNDLTCTGHQILGGPGGVNASCVAAVGCPGMESEGTETTQVKDNPPAGCTYPNGGTDATYQGGLATLCKYDCTVNSSMVGAGGGNGTAGTAGTGGAACTSPWGQVAAGTWTHLQSFGGTAGAGGKGGQGGAAGAGVNNSKSGTCSIGNHKGDLGATGGGGGAGGCGGTPGLAGTSGGASLAVFVASGGGGTWPVIAGNRIRRGYGGAGGPGGNGGAGGKGGNGGAGGGSGWPAWCAGTGGPGGRGGDGGAGGGGAGGCGGPSVGVAVAGGATTTYAATNLFEDTGTPKGGPKGPGGLSILEAAAGKDGTDGGSSDVRGY